MERIYQKALDALREGGIPETDLTAALVAVACRNALASNPEAEELLGGGAFEAYCETVSCLWIDCEDRTCVCFIADWAAEYAARHLGELPGCNDYPALLGWAEDEGLA